MAKIDALVLDEVGMLLDTITGAAPSLQTALKRAWGVLTRPADDPAPLIRTHEQAAEKARERIKRLALLFADGDIDREGYELGRSQAQADLKAAEEELTSLRATSPQITMPSLDDALRWSGGWKAALMEGDSLRQREVLGELIERILPERVGYGRFKAAIVWSSLGEQFLRLAEKANRPHGTSQPQVA